MQFDTGAAYLPLQMGIYQVYDVEEIVFSPDMAPEHLTYELMTEVVDSFPSPNGQYTYVIRRSRRFAEGDPWEPWDTWSARKDQLEAVVMEGNVPFVKVAFPLKKGARWDGNRFNALGEDEYELKEVGVPSLANGMTFENTLTVEQERNEDLIVFNDNRREVYARDVGLIYKALSQLNYCTDDHCRGQQIVTHGIEFKQVIKQYGKH